MSEAAANSLEHHEPETSTGIPNKKVLMWAFLGSDCMFFGTLISTHLIYRKISATVGSNYLDIRDLFDIELTSFSTFVLLRVPYSWLSQYLLSTRETLPAHGGCYLAPLSLVVFS